MRPMIRQGVLAAVGSHRKRVPRHSMWAGGLVGGRSRDRVELESSEVSTTMDLYVHAYEEGLRGAVATPDQALSV